MSSTDVLLTHGYRLFEDQHELAVMKPYPALGILYISSHLKEKGFSVEVFDSTFSDADAFGKRLDEVRPRLVGIYTNLMTRGNVLGMIAIARERGVPVVLGGPDPANHAERYLEHGADVVVIGEGERTVEELIPVFAGDGPRSEALRNITGISFREDDGTVVRTLPREAIKDLDGQPFPDREAIDLERYLETWRTHHGRSAVSLITARGCPYTCTWCSHAVYGYTHRRRSPENVADEVQLILDRYRPDSLWYADDVFTIHRTWLMNYAAELQRRGIRIPFETISREDRLDEEIVETLAAMGCVRLWVGAESGSQRILDAMQRRTDAARVPEVVGMLRRHGIETGMFIMLGYDTEEVPDLEETVAMLKRADPDVFLTTVAYPISGTPYAAAVSDRIIPLASWAEGSDRARTVAGRHSRRFYRFATRWMVGEVGFHHERRRSRSPRRMAAAFMNARIGRLGMRLTAREVERGPIAS
jgi:anaerobic magnesium-protoporphyrin IX monomethyl ester cyclase